MSVSISSISQFNAFYCRFFIHLCSRFYIYLRTTHITDLKAFMSLGNGCILSHLIFTRFSNSPEVISSLNGMKTKQNVKKADEEVEKVMMDDEMKQKRSETALG